MQWLDEQGTLRGGASLGDALLDDLFGRAGAWVLPGLVDAHVHFREPGDRRKEGILNGSRAAAAGGVTTILDMPNNRPPCSTAARLAVKRRRFLAKSQVRWGLHLLADPSAGAAGRVPFGVASVKVYMARASSAAPVVCESALQDIFRSSPRVTIHAEDETCFPANATGTSLPKGALPHALARPREAVVSALAKVEGALRAIPAQDRPRLVVCHMATVEEVAWVRRLKAEGFDIWGETCPHYLVFADLCNSGAGLPLPRGGWYQVNPPIRGEADRQALLQALSDATIDFVSSDHAPHLPAQKSQENPPSGIAGVEYTLAVLLFLASRGEIPQSRLVPITSLAAARCFDLAGPRALSASGAPVGWPGSDLAVVAPVPGAYPPVTRAGFDPYALLPLERRVVATRVDGRFVFLFSGDSLSIPAPAIRTLLGPGLVARGPHHFPSTRVFTAPEVATT
jgi:dihydroorotase-like cyclic amidohydrolase